MEGKKQARAILVFGAPASGKTTFCEKFSRQFRAPYYNLTELAAEYKFSRADLLVILDLIAQTGQNMIIEGGLDTEADREEIKKLFRARDYAPSLVWIQTDVNTIKGRLKTRLKSVSKAKEEYDSRVAKLEAPAEVENYITLSGRQTFQMQLQGVLSRLAD